MSLSLDAGFDSVARSFYRARGDGLLYWYPGTVALCGVEAFLLWIAAPQPDRQRFYQKFTRRYQWRVDCAVQTVALLEEWFYNPEFGEWRPARLIETPIEIEALPNTLSAHLLTLAQSLLKPQDPTEPATDSRSIESSTAGPPQPARPAIDVP